MTDYSYIKNTDMTLEELEAYVDTLNGLDNLYVPRKGTSTGIVRVKDGKVDAELANPERARFVVPVRTSYSPTDTFDTLQVVWVARYDGRYHHTTEYYRHTPLVDIWEIATGLPGETDFVTIHAVHGPNLSLLDARP